MEEKTFVAKGGFLLVETTYLKEKEVLVNRGFYETEEEAFQKGQKGAEWDYLDLFIIPVKSIEQDFNFSGMKSKPYPDPLQVPPENPEITS